MPSASCISQSVCLGIVCVRSVRRVAYPWILNPVFAAYSLEDKHMYACNDNLDDVQGALHLGRSSWSSHLVCWVTSWVECGCICCNNSSTIKGVLLRCICCSWCGCLARYMVIHGCSGRAMCFSGSIVCGAPDYWLAVVKNQPLCISSRRPPSLLDHCSSFLHHTAGCLRRLARLGLS